MYLHGVHFTPSQIVPLFLLYNGEDFENGIFNAVTPLILMQYNVCQLVYWTHNAKITVTWH